MATSWSWTKMLLGESWFPPLGVPPGSPSEYQSIDSGTLVASPHPRNALTFQFNVRKVKDSLFKIKTKAFCCFVQLTNHDSWRTLSFVPQHFWYMVSVCTSMFLCCEAKDCPWMVTFPSNSAGKLHMYYVAVIKRPFPTSSTYIRTLSSLDLYLS